MQPRIKKLPARIKIVLFVEKFTANSCQASAVNCQLSTVNYQLSTINYQLSTDFSQPLATA
ncbi:MAG: hypothetical protein HC849_31975 [Oscillatoriales cyanobacterium RU_3_3]|nr:hypothetical protein [Oscillatoriales cyanobacterium RU_3_3]